MILMTIFDLLVIISSVDVELAECFESLGLTQLVDEPTRHLPDVANLLDVLATNSTKLVHQQRKARRQCQSRQRRLSVRPLSDHC